MVSRRRLPENREMEYQLDLQRDNYRNPASGHSPREEYVKAACDKVWDWANRILPRMEMDRILRSYVNKLGRSLDNERLQGNTGEFRAAWEEVGERRAQYEEDNNGAPAPRALVEEWVAEIFEPIGHLEIGVPDTDLNLKWARPIRRVAKSEVNRLGLLRDRNLNRAGHGRKQVAEAEDCLDYVNAPDYMTLGEAFNF